MARWDDYAASAADGIATVRSAVAEPYGDAYLGQVIVAEAWRGATITLRAQARARDLGGRAELWLHVVTYDRGQSADDRAAVGAGDWAGHEITAAVPEDAELIRFGVTLAGPGRSTCAGSGCSGPRPCIGRLVRTRPGITTAPEPSPVTGPSPAPARPGPAGPGQPYRALRQRRSPS